MASPVHVGEEYDVTIDTVGSKGDGVAKIKGYVVFIKNVQEGDKVKIRITKTLEKVGFGEVSTSSSASKEESSEKKSKNSSEDEMDEEPAEEHSSDADEDEEEMPEA